MSVRWRVDFRHGSYASFSEENYDKAKEAFDDPAMGALRLRKCKDIFDDGEVIEGLPEFVDLTEKFLDDNEKN